MNIINNDYPIQLGEKGHTEYGWSNNIQERILQFYFQLNRTDIFGIERLSFILFDLLSKLKHTYENGNFDEKHYSKYNLSILYRIIGQTRDLIKGKGEYALSYMMIYVWNLFYPKLAEFALKCFVTIDNNIHQYGSWKDLKYFCKYYLKKDGNSNSSLINYCVRLMNEQIKNDYNYFILNKVNKISLVSKWIPREKSSLGWLYEKLATNYFSDFLLTANTDERLIKARLKCKIKYRKILSLLNKEIDTTQIKQCNKNWKNINFNNVTSITLFKQSKAFLNIKNDDFCRINSNDRINCSNNLISHIQEAIKGNINIKEKCIGIGEFVKKASELLKFTNNDIEKELINLQWHNNSERNLPLENMIAMVDLSSSMEGESMNVAIGLGIRIAEKSCFGKRIMVFSPKPTWINLEPFHDFISKVEIIKTCNSGMNSNYYNALELILDSIIENKMTHKEVKNMVLVILSDMQIDYINQSNKQVFYDIINNKYQKAGIKVHGIPYKPPHILFWNLKSNSGFPSLSNQHHCSMISGFNPNNLNQFSYKTFRLQNLTPWNFLEKKLLNERYKIMDDFFNKNFF